jgi:uncharacterized phage infection (PIP) family protein YhgE
MGTKNQLEGEKMQVNPRKIMQQNINQLSERTNQVAGGLSLVIKKIEHLDKNLGGLEQIIMKLAEFLGKDEEFNKYLDDWLKSESVVSKEKSKSVNNAGDTDGDLVVGNSVADKTSSSTSSSDR